MLQNLHVKNLALIDETEVDFRNGLNILSGETGAGKSIIIGSINLALGEKVQKEMLRENADYALVELIFSVTDEKQKELLRELDVFPENDEVILSRKIVNGRGVAKVNAESVPASKMREIASILIDIHGQHEHQSLLSKKKHLEILDDYAKEEIFDPKEKLREAYKNYRALLEELKAADVDEEERLREISFLEYEIKEIEDADLKEGALDEAEAQCIDLGDENGFFSWLWNWLFGKKDNQEEYTGWLTKNGKTYYYSASTHKPVTGIQSVDGKLYYFDADGVMQKNVNFGIDVSKYQTNIDWNKVKKAGVNFVIIRIGYRGYGASGTLVKDPMFEEHFTNARNAGLKVGVYFFTQAVTEDEAREEAQGCNWALNGRKLDYPIYYDTEASTSPNGTGRADGLGKEDRTKCAIAFCEEVKSLGYKPGVYASTTWFRKRVDLDALRKYTIWNAHYGVSSSPIDCDMWQGTEKARINGYSGELDANISYMG